MVRRGFTRAYGHNLSRIINKATKSRAHGFVSGFIVTGLLQSSTATILLLTSFAKKNLISLPAALAVVIGADLSTTIVAQILSFDLLWLSPTLIAAGVIMYKFNHHHGGARKHLSFVLIGLGIMLLSLTLIREAAAPVKTSEALPVILAYLNQDPVIIILLSALITWVVHSSLASVLLFASFASTGLIDLHMGLLTVLGANLGGAIVPLVITWKNGPSARQITFSNVLMRCLILLAALPFIHMIPDTVVKFAGEDTARTLLHAHTGFNIILALVFLPLVKIIANIGTKAFPPAPEDDTEIKPLYLDRQTLDTPAVALANAARETLHMAEVIEDMLKMSITTFEKNDKNLIEKIKKKDNDVDTLYRAIKLYISELSQEGMDAEDADRAIQILTFSTNLEHIGDIIDKSLMELAEKKMRKAKAFSEDGFQEIKAFHKKVLENFHLSQAIFMSKNKELASRLIKQKQAVRDAAENSTEQHFKRLAQGISQTLATSSLHLDIIRDYRQINSYATRLAFTILED